jgi:hypothetical protein
VTERQVAGKGPWSVECPAYVLRTRTREAAEWNLTHIERLGACQNEHKLIDPDGVEMPRDRA